MWSSGIRARPLIGRADVWQALLDRRQQVKDGTGGLTLLEGSGGVGKSTFLSLMAESAAGVGFRVVTAKASWTDDPPPFRTILEVVRQLTPRGAHAPSPWAATPAPVSYPGEPTGASTKAALGAMSDDAHSELASQRLKMLGSISESLIEAVRGTPVLILIDDLHWADEASRTLLLYLLPQISSLPIWILATCTWPSEVDDGSSDPLDPLRLRGEVDRITLRPMTEPEVLEFAHWVLPTREFSKGELHRLTVESDGVPARIVQQLSPSPPSAQPIEGGMPGTLDEEPGLAALDPEARRLLNLALVAGPEFTLEDLAGAAEIVEERAIEYLERFVALGLVHELEDGRFAFDRGQTRDALYTRLGARRSRVYHEKFAQSLMRRESPDIGTVYALARHTYLGGMDREAVDFNQRAASYAAARFQPGVSLLYLRLALDALSRVPSADPRRELRLRLEIIVQQVQQGDAEAAEASLEEIRESARLLEAARPADRVMMAAYRARVLADKGRWDEAEASLREIPAERDPEEPPDLRRASERLRGEILFYRGDYQAALAAHDTALALARAEEKPREIAAESIRRATALSMIPGRAEEAVTEFRSAIERLAELGDPGEAAFGALCLGAQLNLEGKTEEARSELRRAIGLAETAHDPRRAGWAYLNMADLEFGLGQEEPASSDVRKAREYFEQVEDDLGSARAAITEGRLALGRGELGVAHRRFEVARSIFNDRDLTTDEMEVDLRTAEMELARRDDVGARRRLARLIEGGFVRLRPDLIEDARKLARKLGPPELEFA